MATRSHKEYISRFNLHALGLFGSLQILGKDGFFRFKPAFALEPGDIEKDPTGDDPLFDSVNGPVFGPRPRLFLTIC